ncbi:MAG: hypothetical protein ACQERC_11035, partial [Bacteroidota bacterium]
ANNASYNSPLAHFNLVALLDARNFEGSLKHRNHEEFGLMRIQWRQKKKCIHRAYILRKPRGDSAIHFLDG